MKDLNRVFFAATVALGLASVSPVMAQSQLSGPDGTAMSPKTRFLLAQPPAQVIIPAAQPMAAWPSGVNTTGMTGMPKQQQLQAQSQTAQPTPQSTAVAGYRATGPDGITASPKLRQMMDENTVQFQIAPLK